MNSCERLPRHVEALVPSKPEGSLLRAAVAEEVASVLRHDLRNKFAGIRNASVYIKRSLKKSGKLEGDPRVERFLDLIVQQLIEADEMLSERLEFSELLTQERSEQSVDSVLLELRSKWSAVFDELSYDLDAARAFVFEKATLAFCIERILENAEEAGAKELRISTRIQQEEVQLLVHQEQPSFVSDDGSAALTPFETDKSGHLGIGLNIVSRLMHRLGGQLSLPQNESDALRLILPTEMGEPSSTSLDSG